MSQLLTRLSHSCYPPLSALPGAIAFLHAWLSDDKHCLTQMTGGLPPSHWIDDIKAAVTQTYAAMDGMFVSVSRRTVPVDIDTEGKGLPTVLSLLGSVVAHVWNTAVRS